MKFLGTKTPSEKTMSSQEPTNPEVPLDSDLAKVTTLLSDDCSTLTCTLRDKNGQEATFRSNLPTGPHVRAIRQTIEVSRDAAVALQNIASASETSKSDDQQEHQLDSTANLMERMDRLLKCGPSDLLVSESCESPSAECNEAVLQLCSFQHLSEEVAGEIEDLDLEITAGKNEQNSSLLVETDEPSLVPPIR
jgi:hypothetical protein